MNCAIITPIGPNHEKCWEECLTSIIRAIKFEKGPFDMIKPFPVNDLQGELGRSKARNQGVAKAYRYASY